MNWAAQQIEMEESLEHEISLVPFDKVPLIWEKVEKYLKKSAGRFRRKNYNRRYLYMN